MKKEFNWHTTFKSFVGTLYIAKRVNIALRSRHRINVDSCITYNCPTYYIKSYDRFDCLQLCFHWLGNKRPIFVYDGQKSNILPLGAVAIRLTIVLGLAASCDSASGRPIEFTVSPEDMIYIFNTACSQGNKRIMNVSDSASFILCSNCQTLQKGFAATRIKC